MTILADHEIRALARMDQMIWPFAEAVHEPGIISYGLSSYGYDARLADKLKLIRRGPGWGYAGSSWEIDPKAFDPAMTIDMTPDHLGAWVIPSHGFALGHTVEQFRIPRDVLVICLGKSTYARCGLIVNVTPLEPGWEGQVTLELHNTTDVPIRIYPGEGICQFVFLQGETYPEVTYAERKGKYMGQQGVTLPRMPVG